MADRYAEPADLTTHSIPAAAIAGISSGDQEKALNAASSIANGYLSAIFTLPLTEWGEDLKQKVCDMAAYMLIKRRGFSPERGDGDQLRLAYEDAERWLRDIAAGKTRPQGVKDSSTSPSNDTADTAADNHAFVVQPQEGAETEDGFWHRGDSYPGGVGPSRRRGW